LQARPTPGREEIDHDDLAAQIIQSKLRTGGIGDCEWWCGISNLHKRRCVNSLLGLTFRLTRERRQLDERKQGVVGDPHRYESGQAADRPQQRALASPLPAKDGKHGQNDRTDDGDQPEWFEESVHPEIWHATLRPDFAPRTATWPGPIVRTQVMERYGAPLRCGISGNSNTGRISTVPFFAAGIRPAMAIA